jgi:hypothetical protein
VKLCFQGLDLIFMSIRIPRFQIGQTQPFASFQIRSFFDFRTRMCSSYGGACLKTKKNSLLPHGWFFFAYFLLRSRLTMNHGVPMGNPHSNVQRSNYVLARFLGRFARSIATISIVFRVYIKLIIDPWIDHLQDHPMRRKPYMYVHILGA